MIEIRCWKHKGQSLTVVEAKHVPGETCIFVEPCALCLTDADYHGYVVGYEDGKHDPGVMPRPAEPDPDDPMGYKARGLAACGNLPTEPGECDNTATADADGGLAVCPNAKDGTCEHYRSLMGGTK